MPRILGVDIPQDKPTHISLRYIFGIGPTLALQLCRKANVEPQRRAKELTDDDISRLATILDREYTVEGPLAPANSAKHRAAQGHRQLSRDAPPPRVAGARPADPDQRPHPQRAAQNRGRQEGREGNARLKLANPSRRWRGANLPAKRECRELDVAKTKKRKATSQRQPGHRPHQGDL